jgi:hypothetical protein
VYPDPPEREGRRAKSFRGAILRIPGTNAGSGSISRLGGRFADRLPKIPRPGLTNVSNFRNSNREKEAPFFGPSRRGCFSPPAFRPRLSNREPPPKVKSHPSPRHQDSNREKAACDPSVTTNARARQGRKSGGHKDPAPTKTTATTGLKGGKIEIGSPQKCCD